MKIKTKAGRGLSLYQTVTYPDYFSWLFCQAYYRNVILQPFNKQEEWEKESKFLIRLKTVTKCPTSKFISLLVNFINFRNYKKAFLF